MLGYGGGAACINMFSMDFHPSHLYFIIGGGSIHSGGTTKAGFGHNLAGGQGTSCASGESFGKRRSLRDGKGALGNHRFGHGTCEGWGPNPHFAADGKRTKRTIVPKWLQARRIMFSLYSSYTWSCKDPLVHCGNLLVSAMLWAMNTN